MRSTNACIYAYEALQHVVRVYTRIKWYRMWRRAMIPRARFEGVRGARFARIVCASTGERQALP